MTEYLVAGNVVSFNGEGECEVLRLLQNGRAVELQPEQGEPITVRFDPSIIRPVERRPGDQVRSLINGMLGLVQEQLPREGGVAYYRVLFPDGQARTVNESALRGVPITDPIELLSRGLVDQVRDFQLRTMAARLSLAHQYDELTTLSNTRLELKPHQIFVAHRVVETTPHRFLLADEVGLGKTIEAGLVLKELRTRGVATRALIIAPANLTRQWQWELKNKFNESFSLFTAETIAWQRERRPGENVWTTVDSVICSAQYITAGERGERTGQRPSYAHEGNLPQRMQEILQADWDLVIVDEAHHARRSSRTASKQETNILYWFLSHLAQRTPSLLLLTATPMQLDPSELYWLLELLDPALFPSQAHFEQARRQMARINALIGEVRRWEKPGGAQHDAARRARLVAQIVAHLDADGEGEWDEDMVEAALSSPASRQSLLNLLARGHRISDVIIRNRKSEVGGFMPRQPRVLSVMLSPEEQAVYEAVTSYVQEGYRESQTRGNLALGFVMVTFQKLLSSSSHALDRALERRIARLSEADARTRPDEFVVESLDDEELDDEAAERLIMDCPVAAPVQSAATEIAVIRGIRTQVAGIRVDTKLERLRELLRTLPVEAKEGAAGPPLVPRRDRMGPPEGGRSTQPFKVLVFSQFRETVEYLARALSPEFTVDVFHGSLSSEQKDAAARRFRDPRGAQILVSTEAGGEGRNFQFCHVMVNYDLPWNPMRVEQRIGRLDRIGQKHPIHIYNFAFAGTVEERVVEALNRRIRLFEETVGGIEPILGDVARDVRQLIMSQDTHGVELFATRLEQDVQRARELERQRADFVMDMRSFAQQQAQQIIAGQTTLNYEDLRAWARRALEAAGCRLDKCVDRKSVYELRAFDEFKRRFRHIESYPRLVTFNRDRALEDEDLEFLAFGHPLIDAVVDAWLKNEFGGLTTFWKLTDPQLPAFDGYLFNFIAEFSGTRRIRKLYAVAVSRSGAVEAHLGDQLVARCAQYEKPSDFPPEPPPSPGVRACHRAAEQHLNGLLRAECARLGERAAQAFEQEATKLGRYYTYRRAIAAEKVAATEATLAGLRERGEEGRAVLPMWEAKLEQSKRMLAELDRRERQEKERLRARRNVVADFTFLNVARVTNMM